MKINDLVFFKHKDSIVLGFIEQIYTSKFGFVEEFVIKSILELEGNDKVHYNPKTIYGNHSNLNSSNFAYNFIKSTGDKKLLESLLRSLVMDYPELQAQLEKLQNE
jgi:hypothetical protein